MSKCPHDMTVGYCETCDAISEIQSQLSASEEARKKLEGDCNFLHDKNLRLDKLLHELEKKNESLQAEYSDVCLKCHDAVDARESLQAERAMLVEALQTCIMVDEGGTERTQMFNLPKVQHALCTSSESSDQWLHEKLVEMLGESIGVVGLEPDTPLITQRGSFMPTNSTKKAAMMFKDVELGTPLYTLPKR